MQHSVPGSIIKTGCNSVHVMLEADLAVTPSLVRVSLAVLGSEAQWSAQWEAAG